MKKIILSIFTLLAISTGVTAQNVNIPDANFKAYLTNPFAGIDTNVDGEISYAEAAVYSGSIDCFSLSISNLTGIETFTNLYGLNCEDNSLTSLDLSGNSNLVILNCSSNSIGGTLDLSANTNLFNSLEIGSNQFTSVVFPVNSTVKTLKVSSCPLLSQLDVSPLSGLETLFSVSNGSLITVDLTSNTALESATFNFSSGLTSVNNAGLTSLISLSFNGTALTDVDISSNSSLFYFLIANCPSLSSVNMANGNNMSFAPGNFSALNSPQITCIEVDNVAFSNSVWNSNVDPGVTFSTDCSVSTVLATALTVQGQGGGTEVGEGATLQMEATIIPANTTNQMVVWSTLNGTGSATIDVNTGLLTGVSAGLVTVGAFTTDGSNISGATVITVTATNSIDEKHLENISIYPNPVQNELFIELEEGQITEAMILDLSGKLVRSISISNTNSIDVSDLTQGIYILKVSTENGVSTKRFVKQD